MKDSKKIAVSKCIASRVIVDEIGVAKNKIDSIANYISNHPDMTNDEIIERLMDASVELKHRSMKAKCKMTLNDSALGDILKDGSSFKTSGFHISDHAMLRYMQRGIGVDLNELANTMIEEVNVAGSPTIEGTHRINNPVKNIRYLMYGKVVVTIQIGRAHV